MQKSEYQVFRLFISRKNISLFGGKDWSEDRLPSFIYLSVGHCIL
jgi:hypothetical protein